MSVRVPVEPPPPEPTHQSDKYDRPSKGVLAVRRALHLAILDALDPGITRDEHDAALERLHAAYDKWQAVDLIAPFVVPVEPPPPDGCSFHGVSVRGCIDCAVVPVEPPATPGLREALDAHDRWDWKWQRKDGWSGLSPGTVRRDPELPLACFCKCGWMSQPSNGDSAARVKDWMDHREAAVRAALSGPPATEGEKLDDSGEGEKRAFNHQDWGQS